MIFFTARWRDNSTVHGRSLGSTRRFRGQKQWTRSFALTNPRSDELLDRTPPPTPEFSPRFAIFMPCYPSLGSAVTSREDFRSIWREDVAKRAREKASGGSK